MKQNKANPFLVEKYFEEVQSKKISAQDAINLAHVLTENKIEMYHMIKNAGIKNNISPHLMRLNLQIKGQ